MNGLPPHIAQIIAGHRDINVTLGYKNSRVLHQPGEKPQVPPLWAIAIADARPCTWPRTPMLHLPLARAAYSIGAGRRFARGFDRGSRALRQLVAAACQVGGLGGVAR
jgi:hypothetical protein